MDLYSPRNSPGQNTGVGSRSLLQGIFPTQGSNPGLPHCRWIFYQLSHKGSPVQTCNRDLLKGGRCPLQITKPQNKQFKKDPCEQSLWRIKSEKSQPKGSICPAPHPNQGVVGNEEGADSNGATRRPSPRDTRRAQYTATQRLDEQITQARLTFHTNPNCISGSIQSWFLSHEQRIPSLVLTPFVPLCVQLYTQYLQIQNERKSCSVSNYLSTKWYILKRKKGEIGIYTALKI